MYDQQDHIGYPMGDEDAMSYEEHQPERRDSSIGRRKTDAKRLGRRDTIIALTSYALVWIALAVGVGVWQAQQRDSDRADAEQFRQLDALVKTIQDERVSNIRDGCVRQNERYDNAVRAVDHILGPLRSRADQGRLAQIERTRTATILVITALAPHQNCARVVKESTGESQSKKRP